MYPSSTAITATARPPLDPCQDQALNTLKTQRRLTSWPYYSRVKFFAEREAVEPGGPYTYNLAAGTVVRAFAYAVGGAKVIAGFTAGDGNATIADTNLSVANQTIGGQNVMVHGIALQLMPASLHVAAGDAAPGVLRAVDYRFFAALVHSVSVEATLNGDENTYRMGTIPMIPGAGGQVGGAPDQIGLSALAGDQESLPYAANGWQTRSNFFRLPEGLIWRNQSNADSMFNVRFNVTRPLRFFSGGDPENAGFGIDVAANNNPANVATGTQGKAYPATLALELGVILIGEVVGPRTRTA